MLEASPSSPLRFVILRHEMPAGGDRRSHWDLMLEVTSQPELETWAFEQLPAPGQPVTARRLAAHRRQYLDYEGPIAGDRGHVTRWDAGTYALEQATDSVWRLTLSGLRLRNVTLALTQLEAHSATYVLELQ